MPTTTLQTTINLSPYFLAHKKELTFEKKETPQPQEVTIETRKLNWFGRCVKKIDNPNSTIINIGKLLLCVSLAISLIGIPVLILFVREKKLLIKDKKSQEIALEKLNIQNKQWNKRAEIVENLDIQDFANLPILNLQGRMGSTQYIDFLAPKDMNAPLMKGLDKFERPFIAFKMINKNSGHTFVMTLFQRYTDLENWTWIGEGGLNNPLSHLITAPYINQKEAQIFAEIIKGTHSQFALADNHS